ncbi:helix-turn-helix domain-containing protein [Peterkaempfera griseoplana]|uniref:helix-turn-helix domain-containing protein n=1 Tax=Peterkaempfera griseoplana TaxID=66896 RepID=UPI00389A61B0
MGLKETGTARRTQGLRRDEVAELAHMPVDYRTQLDPGRGPRPSARILDALARVLRRTPAERSHLFRLAGSSPRPAPAPCGRSAPTWPGC